MLFRCRLCFMGHVSIFSPQNYNYFSISYHQKSVSAKQFDNLSNTIDSQSALRKNQKNSSGGGGKNKTCFKK